MSQPGRFRLVLIERLSVASTPKFVLNPALAQHVASMIARKVIEPEAAMDALVRCADRLAAWPPDRKKMLSRALQSLEQNCPIRGLWSRVGFTEDQPGV
ncbi:MAG: hypothetical protein IH993_01045 [Proteobacteria bacterium]|nr:hypothetical protein [Pseudomonadota bacterium]